MLKKAALLVVCAVTLGVACGESDNTASTGARTKNLAGDAECEPSWLTAEVDVSDRENPVLNRVDFRGRTVDCFTFPALTPGSDFTGSRLSKVKIFNIVAPRTTFSAATMASVRVSRSNFSGSDFRWVQFSTPERDSGFLWISSFDTQADLREADFSYSKFMPRKGEQDSLRFDGVNLASANFTRSVMNGVQFVNSDLTGARMVDADLANSVFSGSNLTGADFSGADLGGADLRGVDLSTANLQGAILYQTRVGGAALPPGLNCMEICSTATDGQYQAQKNALLTRIREVPPAPVVETVGTTLQSRPPGDVRIAREGGPCNDNNAATANDVIVNGRCEGRPVNCDDRNSATNDRADVQRGCVYTPRPDKSVCDDGDPLTSPDYVVSGVCVPGPSMTTSTRPASTTTPSTTTVPLPTTTVPATTSTVNYSNNVVDGADFTGRIMIDGDFTGAQLRNASFVRANLYVARFAQAVLTGSNFTDAILRRADFWNGFSPGARLDRTNLTRADLRSADLRRVRLDNSILTNADFSGSDLDLASFRDAILDGANFSGANLTGADLRGAQKLVLATFSRTNMADARLPEGFDCVASGAVNCPVPPTTTTVAATTTQPLPSSTTTAKPTTTTMTKPTTTVKPPETAAPRPTTTAPRPTTTAPRPTTTVKATTTTVKK